MEVNLGGRGKLNWPALGIVGIGILILVIAWEGTHKRVWGILSGTPVSGSPTSQPSMTAQQSATSGVASLGFGSGQYQITAWLDALQSGIDPVLFEKQINQESGFNPLAKSPAGAEGIAQFMPATAAGLNIDPWNPQQALAGASNLMKNYYTKYGSYQKALAAYNAGPAAVDFTLGHCTDPRGWLYCMDSQTQNYVHTITGTGGR